MAKVAVVERRKSSDDMEAAKDKRENERREAAGKGTGEERREKDERGED